MSSSMGTLRISLPFLKRISLPSPPAMPISALPSPMLLTTQPRTETFNGVLIWPSFFSTIRHAHHVDFGTRPQVGQAMTLMPRCRNPVTSRFQSLTLTSSRIGGGETRSVSPIPCESSHPRPIADLTAPVMAVPASVDADMQGIIGLGREQIVCVNCDDIGSLERHLHVGEAFVLERMHGV